MAQLYLKGVYYDTESEGLWYLDNSGTYQEIPTGGTSYLVYTANLTSQSGSGAPSFSVQQDTIEDIVWSRDSTGYYKGTKAGAFLAGKVWSSINGAGGVDPKVLQLVRESDDVIALYCYTDNTLNTLVDIEVSGAIIPLKIEVYP